MKLEMKRIMVSLCITGCVVSSLSAQTKLGGYERIDSLINQMTIEEKVRMCFGGEKFGEVLCPGVERLGIPPMYPSDGPRGYVGGTSRPATSFPSGLGMAASWNEELMKKAGEVMGKEFLYYGQTLMFGPAINLNRDVLGGRFFEYLSEDPVLSGRMGGAQILGTQSVGVAACMKHFALNGRELNRNEYSSNIDERTLRELYLRNFQIAYNIGNPWAVMTAANKVNHDYASDSKLLLNDILKGEWGFKGMVITDFCNTRSTEKAAFGGLDIGMPWGNYATMPYGKSLTDAVESGRVPLSVLNDMVRRVLWVRYQVGLLDGALDAKHGEESVDSHHAVALQAAQESIVLLKNDKDLLPIDESKVKNLVVMGSNADNRLCVHILGGSSGVHAKHEITPLKAFKARAEEKGYAVEYLPLSGTNEFLTLTSDNVLSEDNKPGFNIRYYNTKNGELLADTIVEHIDFNWVNSSPYPGRVESGYIRIVCDGYVSVPETGFYSLRLTSDCPTEFWANDMGAMAIRHLDSGQPQVSTTLCYIEKNKPYHLRLWYSQNPEGVRNSREINHWSSNVPSIKIEWAKPATVEGIASQIKQYKEKITQADYVIFIGGTDHTFDGEGKDRQTMDFPKGQAELLKQVLALQPNTVVVLYNGSPFTVDWMQHTPTVLDGFFPGMEGGTAIADVIFGDYNPSGRLPFTWPKKLADTPVYGGTATQDFENVNYEEKAFFGYRWNDLKRLEPAFPFGFGLSYTDYSFSKLKIKENKDKTYTVTLNVKNTGNREGTEVVQLYVGQKNCKYVRPLKELKDFKRVSLKAGESKKVSFILDKESFMYWNPDLRAWHVDDDIFTVFIAKNADEVILSADISVIGMKL